MLFQIPVSSCILYVKLSNIDKTSIILQDISLRAIDMSLFISGSLSPDTIFTRNSGLGEYLVIFAIANPFSFS